MNGIEIEMNQRKRKALLNNFEELLTEQEFFVLFNEEIWKSALLNAFFENENVRAVTFTREDEIYTVEFAKEQNHIHMTLEKEQEDVDDLYYVEEDIKPEECEQFLDDADWLTVTTVDNEQFGYCLE